MDIETFRFYAALIVDCIFHDGAQGEPAIEDHMDQVLAYFDCPQEWGAIVKLASRAASYYGYEDEVFTKA
jgi:hypothetical protein